jgi:hypothetical protein
MLQEMGGLGRKGKKFAMQPEGAIAFSLLRRLCCLVEGNAARAVPEFMYSF